MKQILITLLGAVALPAMLSAAEVVKDTVPSGNTNAPATHCFLSTNKHSFFYANNLTSSTFIKFSPTGFYEVTRREHMGIVPWDSGRWSQDTNGLITLSSNEQKRHPSGQKVQPMTYRERTFLVWPDVSYKSHLQQVCQELSTGKTPPYHEFLISEEEYQKGTATPQPFRYYKQMNKVTGAKE